MGKRRASEPPEAISLCMTHIRQQSSLEENPNLIWAQSIKGEDERDRARVLIRLCEGAIKKEKYTKGINNLRALILLTHRFRGQEAIGEPGLSFEGQSEEEARRELKVIRCCLTALSLRLIANLMNIEGREPVEVKTAPPHACTLHMYPSRHSACFHQQVTQAYDIAEAVIDEGMRVQFAPQVRRALKLELHLPQRRGGFQNMPHLFGEEMPEKLKLMGMTWPPKELPPLPSIALPLTRKAKGDKSPEMAPPRTKSNETATFEMLKELYKKAFTHHTVSKMILRTLSLAHTGEPILMLNTVGISGAEDSADLAAPWARSMNATAFGLSMRSGTMQLQDEKFTLFVPLLLDIKPGQEFVASVPRGSEHHFYNGCIGCVELQGSRLGKGFSNPAEREEIFATTSTAARLLNEKGMESRRMWRMHTLVQACTSTFWQLNYAEIMAQFETQVKDLFKAEVLDIYVVAFNKKHNTYELHLANFKEGQTGLKREMIVPFGMGISGDVADTGKAVNLYNAHKDPRYHPRFDRGGNIDADAYDTRSILSVPMHTRGGKMIGVVQLTNRVDGMPFTSDDVAVLKTLGDATAQAMENSINYHSRTEDLMKREGEIGKYKEVTELAKDQRHKSSMLLLTQALRHVATMRAHACFGEMCRNFKNNKVDEVNQKIKRLARVAAESEREKKAERCKQRHQHAVIDHHTLQLTIERTQQQMEHSNTPTTQPSEGARTYIHRSLQFLEADAERSQANIVVLEAEIELAKMAERIDELKKNVKDCEKKQEQVTQLQQWAENSVAGVQWSWEDRDSIHVVYEHELNVCIELAYQDYIRQKTVVTEVQFYVNNLPYKINFPKMLQILLSSGAERKITRKDYKLEAQTIFAQPLEDQIHGLMAMPLDIRQVLIRSANKESVAALKSAAGRMGIMLE